MLDRPQELDAKLLAHPIANRVSHHAIADLVRVAVHRVMVVRNFSAVGPGVLLECRPGIDVWDRQPLKLLDQEATPPIVFAEEHEHEPKTAPLRLGYGGLQDLGIHGLDLGTTVLVRTGEKPVDHLHVLNLSSGDLLQIRGEIAPDPNGMIPKPSVDIVRKG